MKRKWRFLSRSCTAARMCQSEEWMCFFWRDDRHQCWETEQFCVLMRLRAATCVKPPLVYGPHVRSLCVLAQFFMGWSGFILHLIYTYFEKKFRRQHDCIQKQWKTDAWLYFINAQEASIKHERSEENNTTKTHNITNKNWQQRD